MLYWIIKSTSGIANANFQHTKVYFFQQRVKNVYLSWGLTYQQFVLWELAEKYLSTRVSLFDSVDPLQIDSIPQRVALVSSVSIDTLLFLTASKEKQHSNDATLSITQTQTLQGTPIQHQLLSRCIYRTQTFHSILL